MYPENICYSIFPTTNQWILPSSCPLENRDHLSSTPPSTTQQIDFQLDCLIIYPEVFFSCSCSYFIVEKTRGPNHHHLAAHLMTHQYTRIIIILNTQWLLNNNGSTRSTSSISIPKRLLASRDLHINRHISNPPLYSHKEMPNSVYLP